MKFIYDVETDDLLLESTRMWVLCLYDIETKIFYEFLEGDLGWKVLLSKATLLVGHNIANFDNGILKRLFDFNLPDNCKIHDTIIMSKVLDYRRFGHRWHSLEDWGQLLEFNKMDFRQAVIDSGLISASDPKAAEFKKYTPLFQPYCRRDVEVTIKVYDFLKFEFLELFKKAPRIKHYMQAEHAVAEFNMKARIHGWPFDKEKALVLKDKLEKQMKLAYNALSEKLGLITVPVDKKKGEIEVKSPKWTKQGYYYANIAEWFGIDPISGLDDPELNECPGHRRILGDYCRIKIRPLSLNSVADVKVFLERNGWKPTEWNYKQKGRKRVKTTPKITEDSLEFLGGDGKLYVKFLTARSRLGILNTWLENTDENGFLHGDSMSIGTPSMRMTHSIIVNVPSGDSEWGKEMRQLFTCPPGYKIIGCDSAGNQMRGFAHYLKNEELIHTLLHKDIHIYNAEKIIEALDLMGITHDYTPKSLRPIAKRILYAFLFGASGAKLWSYLMGVSDAKQGNKFKRLFMKAIPGFTELVDKLARIFGATKKYGYGYIPGIAGNRIYVDSFHKLLVYLLQACEKATCSSALMYTVEELKRKKIPYTPLIMMHDEFQIMAKEQYAEEICEIGIKSFREGPKAFGITIMDGDGKIGDNWYETH